MPSLAAPNAVNLFASSLPSFFLFRRRKQSYELNPPEETHQVIYLGNVLTIMGKGEASVEKPLNVIWRTWNAKRAQRQPIAMRLSVTRSGLKAETKQLGVTDYWAHRTTFCMAPPQYPRVFCWVYKHEGKRMKPELRCHAVLCKRASEPLQLSTTLNHYLQAALQEYKREKLAAERTRKHSVLSSCPRRKMLLQTGTMHFRPPVSRSRSVPRLGSIDEDEEKEEEEERERERQQKEEELRRIQQSEMEAKQQQQCQQPVQSARFHGEEEEMEEEMVEYGEEEDFSDLDSHSLQYRNTPMLSGDSTSQQSTSSGASTASSSSNCGDGKRHGDDGAEEEEDGEGERVDCLLANLLLNDDDGVEAGEEEEDCCSASTSSQVSSDSADTSTNSASSTGADSGAFCSHRRHHRQPPNANVAGAIPTPPSSPASKLLLVIPPNGAIPAPAEQLLFFQQQQNGFPPLDFPAAHMPSAFSVSAPPMKKSGTNRGGGLRYRIGGHIWPFQFQKNTNNGRKEKNGGSGGKDGGEGNTVVAGQQQQQHRRQTILVIGQ